MLKTHARKTLQKIKVIKNFLNHTKKEEAGNINIDHLHLATNVSSVEIKHNMEEKIGEKVGIVAEEVGKFKGRCEELHRRGFLSFFDDQGKPVTKGFREGNN